MTTFTIEDAQAKLSAIIGGLSKRKELAIVEGERVVTRLVGELTERKHRLPPKFAEGIFSIVADDDEHLKDFAEYMP